MTRIGNLPDSLVCRSISMETYSEVPFYHDGGMPVRRVEALPKNGFDYVMSKPEFLDRSVGVFEVSPQTCHKGTLLLQQVAVKYHLKWWYDYMIWQLKNPGSVLKGPPTIETLKIMFGD